MSQIAETVASTFSQSNKRAFRNPWVIGWISLVLIVLAVNAFMISLAFITSPGLVTKDYYEKGRDYERTLASQAAARSALGWHVKLDVPESSLIGQPDTYRFVAVDKLGLPLAGADVQLQMYRPSDATADFTVAMKEVAPGLYEVPVALPLKGIWDLIVHVTRGEDTYEVTRRVSAGV